MRNNNTLLLGAVVATLGLLTACGSKEPPAPAPTADAAAPAEAPPAAAPAPGSAPVATTPAMAPKPAPKPAAATPTVVKPAAPAPKPVPVQVVTLPVGTVLPLSLSAALSTKSAKVGDPVSAVLTSDIMVDGRIALASGATVAGSVIKVVSGSDKVGGTPTLGITFDRVQLPGGTDVPINGTISQQGKSDTARDTVKIVGGTAAGAIIGDKVIKGKKGKFIGGLLGGAVGAVAAKKTGTEVKLDEGTAMSVTLDAPVEITK